MQVELRDFAVHYNPTPPLQGPVPRPQPCCSVWSFTHASIHYGYKLLKGKDQAILLCFFGPGRVLVFNPLCKCLLNELDN